MFFYYQTYFWVIRNGSGDFTLKKTSCGQTSTSIYSGAISASGNIFE